MKPDGNPNNSHPEIEIIHLYNMDGDDVVAQDIMFIKPESEPSKPD